MASDFFRSPHRVEHTLNNLLRASAVRHVRRLRLEQLGMREHDAELVIQLVKQQAELWIRNWNVHLGVIRAKQHVHAVCPVVAACAVLVALAGRALASRHSVSAKMRIDPPAVRTYSTFPAEIQL
jgi:hypothetical protein